MTRIRVLGQLAVVTSSGDVVSLPRGLPGHLLGFLALHRRPVPRREVADHLWPNVDQGSSLRRLRTALWEVQRVLADEAAPVIDSTRTTLALSPSVVVDVDEAEALLRSGADEAAFRLLEPGLSADLDQEWASPARRRTDALLLEALERLVEQSADPHVALGYARRRVDLDALSESAHQDLIRCLARAGDRGAAFAAYAGMRDVLQRELGTGPSADSRRLLAQLAGDETPVAAGRSRGPALPRGRGRLPLSPTLLIGRDDELARVLLGLRDSRLVTLVGIGGMGKSRLAVAAAEQLRNEGSVTFVELAATRQPETCAYVVAAQLGVVAGQGRSIIEAITESLEAEPGLLVLDNCEHVRETLADLVTHVVARCADTRILATSRERLAVPGEHVVPLAPLAIPAADESEATTLASPSVRLLIDAAARRGASPEMLQDAPALRGLAQTLDGIPLALELAGGRLTTFEAAELTQTLQRGLSILSTNSAVKYSEDPGRHDSLVRTFDWSLSTLAPEDRHLLALMATCPAQLPFDLVDTLGRALTDGSDPAAALARIVEAGLVRAIPGPRWSYSMLEPVRLYAEHQLEATARQVAETGLISWATSFCGRMAPLLEVDEIAADLEFDLYFPLIRQAVHTARALADFDAERRIVHHVDAWATWRQRPEAWNWVVDLANDPQGRSDDALTYKRAAVACWRQGRMREMSELTDRCVRADRDGDQADEALMMLAWAERRWADVVHHASRVVETSNAARAFNKGIWSASLVYLGDLESAFELAEQSRAFADETGMPTVQALSMEMLGRVYAARRLSTGDGPDAEPFFAEARRLALSVGAVEMQAAICLQLADQALAAAQPRNAIEPLVFVCEYWLIGGHRPHDQEAFLLMLDALDRTGLTNSASALRDLIDTHQLTLRRFREAIATAQTAP